MKKETQTESRNRRRILNKKFFLSDLWSKMKLRTTNKTSKLNVKYYNNLKLCNKQDFINKFIKDKNFNELHSKWIDLNCEYKFTPSIDRINKKSGYTLDNLQFITHSENCGKDKEKLPILMYDLNNVFIKEWSSKWEAHKALNIPNGNLVKCCYGERKSAGGYIWKFKTR